MEEAGFGRAASDLGQIGPAGSPASPAPTEAVRGWLGRPIRHGSTADRRRHRQPLHARERATPARVSVGEKLTEVVEVRRGLESAEARSRRAGAGAELACRG
jgi:hypothetical protein